MELGLQPIPLLVLLQAVKKELVQSVAQLKPKLSPPLVTTIPQPGQPTPRLLVPLQEANLTIAPGVQQKPT